MTRQMDTAYGIKRIESKNARAAIIQKISADFNLRFPIVAEAYYKQISTYFAQHANVQLTIGTNLLRGCRRRGTRRQTHRFSEKSFLSPETQ